MSGYIGKGRAVAAVSSVGLGDSEKIQLGNDNDLQIYHDGSHSYIKENGTGQLFVEGTELRLRDSSGANYFGGNSGAEAFISYAGSTKLATTSTGINVKGDSSEGSSTPPTIAILDSSDGTWSAAHDSFGNLDFENMDAGGAGSGGVKARISAQVTSTSGTTSELGFYHGSGTTLTRGMLLNSTGIDVTGSVTCDGLSVTDNNASIVKQLNLGAAGTDSAYINAAEHLFINIDSDNNSTTNKFVIAHNGTGASGTELLKIDSSNTATFAGTVICDGLQVGYAGASTQQADGQALTITTPASGGGQGIALKRLDSNSDQTLGELSWSNNTQDGLATITGKTAGAVNTSDLLFKVNNAGIEVTALTLKGNGYVDMVGGNQVRLSLGSTGTAGTNTCNWIRSNGVNFDSNSAGGHHSWEVSGTQRMRLTSGGNLVLGETSTTYSKAHVNGAIAHGNANNDSNATTTFSSPFNNVNAGTIELVSGAAGTSVGGSKCIVTYAPGGSGNWKSFYTEIKCASTAGGYWGASGGYNNNGGSVNLTTIQGGSGFGVTATSSGQSLIWTINIVGIHPFVSIKLTTSGGAGMPEAGDFTFVWS
jgi:hypothetical protein